jgi:hypothetical protein
MIPWQQRASLSLESMFGAAVIAFQLFVRFSLFIYKLTAMVHVTDVNPRVGAWVCLHSLLPEEMSLLEFFCYLIIDDAGNQHTFMYLVQIL